MNAIQVCEKLSKAIIALEGFRQAQATYPKEATGALEFFLKCYPKRAALIADIVGSSHE